MSDYYKKIIERRIGKLFHGQDFIKEVVPDKDWLLETIERYNKQVRGLKETSRGRIFPTFQENIVLFLAFGGVELSQQARDNIISAAVQQEPGEIVQEMREIGLPKNFELYYRLYDLLMKGGYTIDDVKDVAGCCGIPNDAVQMFILLPLKVVEGKVKGMSDEEFEKLEKQALSGITEERAEHARRYFEENPTMMGNVFAQLGYLDTHNKIELKIDQKIMLAYMRASKYICEEKDIKDVYDSWCDFCEDYFTQLQIFVMWLGSIKKIGGNEETRNLTILRGVFVTNYYVYTEQGKRDFFQNILPILCSTPADKLHFIQALKEWGKKEQESQGELAGEFRNEYKSYLDEKKDKPVLNIDHLVPIQRVFDVNNKEEHCTIPLKLYKVDGNKNGNVLYDCLSKLYKRLCDENGDLFEGDKQTFIYRLSGIKPKPAKESKLTWKGSIGELAYLLSRLYMRGEGGTFENGKLKSFFSFPKSKGEINLSSSADNLKGKKKGDIDELLKSCGFKIE